MRNNITSRVLAFARSISLGLASILLIQVLLRIPNFFEPYWYGDEGIYLTIGNALSSGARLYADIVDHKTPLIYYFASIGSQLDFRFFLTIWTLIGTSAFYGVAQAFLRSRTSSFIATIAYMLLTTLPALEGNIPNGELFVLSFVLVALYLITKTAYFAELMSTSQALSVTKRQRWVLFCSGILLGLGILTKVPALLDFGVALTIGWFALIAQFSWKQRSVFIRKVLLPTIVDMFMIAAGTALPILLSILYYALRGTGSDYLNFGLLYNLHYSGTWKLTFESAYLTALFSLPGKTLVMAIAVLTFSFLRKQLSPPAQVIASWVVISLFASLLSNRPYPHYFIQVVPAVALLLGLMSKSIQERKQLLSTSILTSALTLLILAVFQLLNFVRYPTYSYYERFFQLMTNRISHEQYRNSFDSLMATNYAVAPVIMQSSDPYLFIWGTNPTLYALTKKQPVGKFTVAFHITDLNAYGETIEAVQEKRPEYIVVMRGETAALPGLTAYLYSNYIPNYSYEKIVLWRRRSISTL